VKVFAAILWRDGYALEDAVGKLSEAIGEIDFQGPDHPFACTCYYTPEMGPDLRRRIVSFAPLAPPEAIVAIKLATNAIEDALRGPDGRLVNIDSGYMDAHKVVLASAKYGGPKIHVGGGIYADLVLRYSKGKFLPFEWTFLDFKEGTYDEDLLAIRAIYKKAMRGWT
jgi:hypothetical protein